MDKTFNFFKSKVRKENQRPRNNSKSNSSKGSYSRNSDKPKQTIVKPPPLTKKQKQIREAIEFRYQKSKIRYYKFQRVSTPNKREASSHSSQMEEYRHLKRLQVVDVKQYHKKHQSLNYSNHSSQERKKFNMRFKFRDNNSSTIMKTEGNDSSNKNPYLHTLIKNITPTKISKKTEEWKFISIQLKQDLSKPKNRKTEVKINSHRSYNMQQEKGAKIKSNSSMSKYLDKVPKLKQLSKLNKNKF